MQVQGDHSQLVPAAHTSKLVPDDFVWQRGYNWYPDTPGQYPDSKWSWYYDSGGLYDQRHELAVIPANSEGPSEKPQVLTFLSALVWFHLSVAPRTTALTR